ncbi:phosphomethylpyrimidine synthase [Acrocarpospora corrugata]|uniref:Phosphomethylpyrimidine synthase n=2 Tax=Acrocarpospora corrugata TaxID=35763 RepID=A0A5M3WAN8_9ACTN|nr:phosphomethylpyrimidine synthase [Acrocarpospora corrugata]
MMGRPHPPVLGVIIGITPGETTSELEYAKAVRAQALGVNTLTDVTTNDDRTLRRRILETLDISCGTVPTYEIHRRIRRRGENSRSAVLGVLEEQAKEGVDFVTIHASGTREMALRLDAATRAIPVTSRGGAMMVEVTRQMGEENPYLANFDDVLDICAAHGMALSLAGTYRPGSIADALDRTHLDEVREQAELVRRAQARGVKVSVELVNHVPLHLIPVYCELGAAELHGAPFGALGPTPTDIGIGYDDVVGAIGAVAAAQHGTSWITCVTAGEHCHMPTIDDMEQAVKYFQISLHIAAISRHGDVSRDAKLSEARNRNDWAAMADLAIHRDDAVSMFDRLGYHEGQACTMCSGACPLVRTTAEIRRAPR